MGREEASSIHQSKNASKYFVMLLFHDLASSPLSLGGGEKRACTVTTACAYANPYQETMVIEMRPYVLFAYCIRCMQWLTYQALFFPPQESLGTKLGHGLAHVLTHTAVAEIVLNKCTSTNADRNVRPDSEDYAVTFNYEFLEDRDEAE